MKRYALALVQFRVLYRAFLFRIVDLEILAPRGDMSRLLGQFAALLIVVSLLLSLGALAFANRTPPPVELMQTWSAEHFLVATTMLVIAIFAVLSWESTFPDRRDILVLAPLPVRPSILFAAKIAAVATALSLAVATLHIAAGVVWPLTFATHSTPQSIPALTSQPAMAPLDPDGLKGVLDRDLADANSADTRALAGRARAGLVIGVSKHGTRRIFAWGTAKPDSIFEIGSITKTFTAFVLARMVAQGKVKLQQPASELLPAGSVRRLPGVEITLLDLATHHSGLPREPGNRGSGFGADAVCDWLAARGLTRRANTRFFYSNAGFGLLGFLLANGAGTSFPDLLREQVTGPLGLGDTVITLSPEQQQRFIAGYAGGRPVRAPDPDILPGDGAIRSTAGDILTYLDAQLHPEKFARG